MKSPPLREARRPVRISRAPSPTGPCGCITVSFRPNVSPPLEADGIMIDKPWASTPDTGNVTWDDKDALVTAKIDSGDTALHGKTVILTADPPSDKSLKLFSKSGALLPSTGGKFLATFSKDGTVQFSVGSGNNVLFDLTASYDGANGTRTARLLLADLEDSFTSGAMRPSIPDLSSGTPQIPSGGLTFLAYMAGAGNLDSAIPVAVWLNKRIVFRGPLSEAAKGFNVSYASLMTVDENRMVCAYQPRNQAAVLLSQPLNFDASGIAQTTPLTGVDRPLAAPLLPDGDIDADAIAGGYPVTIPAYSGAKAGDQVSLYCYLNGNAVPDEPSNTIIQLDYSGTVPTTIIVPQMYMAGYGPGKGTFSADYAVARTGQSGVIWSKTKNKALDTATLA